MKPSRRIEPLQSYYFARKREEIRKLAEEGGPAFISLAIGNPDLPPPQEVVETLKKALEEEGAHSYQSYGGLPAFKRAIADFYRQKFDVCLDPETQILPLMGSKSGILYLYLAYLNAEEKVLIPDPGYMAYKGAAYLADAVPECFDLVEENGWQPDWDQLERKAEEAKIMWLNYVNMPTGVQVTDEELKKAVELAKRKDIILAFDNPYSLITEQPASILKYAKDAPVVEFQSMSKNFNMAGWRIGWIAGHPDIIASVSRVQNNVESGMFYAIQKAAARALQLSGAWMDKLNAIYARRREKVKALASLFNGTCEGNTGGMFCWVKLPPSLDANKLADELFYRYRIFVAPGTIFGEKWSRYVRISLTVPLEKYDEAIKRLSSWKK